MAQAIYTFTSPVDTSEMVNIIVGVVEKIGGKSKVSGNTITAKWRSRRFKTILAKRFTFYVGKDMVRVVTPCGFNYIEWEWKCYGLIRLWDDFVVCLTQMYPDLDFQLKSGKYHIVSAKIMSDGIEQTFSSTSVRSPSIGRALIGGALFGEVGAIVGASHSRTHTSGSTKTVFSRDVLVSVRYSNGLNVEGTISKKSRVYNQILANLSELTDGGQDN